MGSAPLLLTGCSVDDLVHGLFPDGEAPPLVSSPAECTTPGFVLEEQTAEDLRIDVSGFSTVDPASVRFQGTVGEQELYLGNAGGSIWTFTHETDAESDVIGAGWTSSCNSWMSFGDGVTFMAHYIPEGTAALSPGDVLADGSAVTELLSPWIALSSPSGS